MRARFALPYPSLYFPKGFSILYQVEDFYTDDDISTRRDHMLHDPNPDSFWSVTKAGVSNEMNTISSWNLRCSEQNQDLENSVDKDTGGSKRLTWNDDRICCQSATLCTVILGWLFTPKKDI